MTARGLLVAGTLVRAGPVRRLVRLVPGVVNEYRPLPTSGGDALIGTNHRRGEA